MRRLLLPLTSVMVLATPASASWAADGPAAPGFPSSGGSGIIWTNLASGACLDQDYTDGQQRDSVLAWPCNGGPNQHWYLRSADQESFFLINVASGACLDQDYTDGQPHQDVLAWSCNGGPNQRWVRAPGSV